MSRTPVTIETRDGKCPASVFRPESGAGPWPAVLFFMDGVGIRPALFEMGERMAQHGFFVLLPDMFYRQGPYAPLEPKALFSAAPDSEIRRSMMAKMGALTPEALASDTKAFLDFLAAQADVKQPKVGATGYCMGGGMALRAAAAFPERVVAAGSFHGARLATDAPDSPHLLAPKIKAKVLVAGAHEDQFFPEEQRVKLDEALTKAGVDHRTEIWPAKHGWVPSDTPVHDEEQAERHYEELFALFDGQLKG
jgi:carboxymethylenebutenolidase